MGSPRPLFGLVSMVLLVVVGLIAFLPDCASACSCAALPGTPQEQARQALSGSEAVFAGVVISVEERTLTSMVEGTVLYGEGAPATVTLRVSEVWKGPEQKTLEVETADSESICGYPFRSGERYLVYAGEDMSVGLCGETKPLSESSADLEALGDGEAPKDGAVLSDTSGGVPVRAMAGLAGLTIAASFALVLRLMRTDEV